MNRNEVNPNNNADSAMLRAGKEKFEELYALSEEERNKLREESAYRLALMDLWEIAASSRGMTSSQDAFYRLFGQAAYGIVIEKIQIKEDVRECDINGQGLR